MVRNIEPRRKAGNTITFAFEPRGDDASRLHLAQEEIPEEMQKDCVQGWSESFDKLVRYLAGRMN